MNMIFSPRFSNSNNYLRLPYVLIKLNMCEYDNDDDKDNNVEHE